MRWPANQTCALELSLLAQICSPSSWAGAGLSELCLGVGGLGTGGLSKLGLHVDAFEKARGVCRFRGVGVFLLSSAFGPTLKVHIESERGKIAATEREVR